MLGHKGQVQSDGFEEERDRDSLGKPETPWDLLGCQLTVTFTKDAPQGDPELSPKEKANLLPSSC